MTRTKGFVFTLDAVFSLIFAAVAISVLLYVHFSSEIPASIQGAQARSVLQSLAGTSAAAAAGGSALWRQAVASADSRGYGWPQYGRDGQLSSATGYGPSEPYLLYSYTAPSDIIPVPVVGGGVVAFAAAGEVYALNATTGRPAPNYPYTTSGQVISSPLIYGNEIIFANSVGYISALSAGNGIDVLWSSDINYKYVTTPLEMEDGHLVFGVRNQSGYGYVYAIDPVNGTVAASYPTSTPDGGLLNSLAFYNGGFFASNGLGAVSMPSVLGAGLVAMRSNTPGFAGGSGYYAVTNGSTVCYHGPSNYLSNALAHLGIYCISPSGNILGAPAIGDNYSIFGAGGSIIEVDLARMVNASFGIAQSTYNTTPSIAGDTGYLLAGSMLYYYNRSGGVSFSVKLPRDPYQYNYSQVAVAYGDAYVPDGNTLYVFGEPRLRANESMLSALGNLYLNGGGGLADLLLYNFYNSSGIGMYLNNSYAPALHVANFSEGGYAAVQSGVQVSPEAGNAGNMSACAWYKINSLAGYHGLLYKGTVHPSNGNIIEYAMDPGGASQGFAVYAPSGTEIAYANAVSPLTANQVGHWYFSCFVYSYKESLADFYLNGTLYPGTFVGGTPAGYGSGRLVIGGGVGGSSNALVADVQVYNSLISGSQVVALYREGPFGMPLQNGRIMGWWPLLGDANDYSGNSNIAYPSNVIYTNSGYAPQYLGSAYEISRAGMPVVLDDNGIAESYNVSVVLWSS